MRKENAGKKEKDFWGYLAARKLWMDKVRQTFAKIRIQQKIIDRNEAVSHSKRFQR